jgi:hypothetical protein
VNKIRSLMSTVAVAAALSAAGAGAHAATVTFDDLPTGSYSGTTTEAGFVRNIVGMFVDFGELEALCCSSGGSLTLTKSDSGLFSFTSIDWQHEYADGRTSSVTIQGFVGATLVATDVFSTSSTAYATFAAVSLASLAIDRLVVTADRSSIDGGSMDNIVLGAAGTVPAPLSLSLVGLGLAALALQRRNAR